jgi:hypothetical protein
MNKKIITILIIISFLCGLVPIQGATNEGYGEDSTALGQFVDNYEDNLSVSVFSNVIQNDTLECLELDVSFVEIIENYTSYTKVGADSVVSLDDYNISFVQYMRGTEESYYFDYGVDAVGDFEYYFDVVVSDVEAGDASSRNMINLFMVCNWIGDLQDQPVGTYDYVFVAVRNSGTQDDKYIVSVVVAQDGAQLGTLSSALYNVSPNVLYFVVNRTNGNFNVSWYSDLSRTVLIESMSYNGGGLNDTYQYVYGIQAVDAVGDAGDWCSGSVANLWLGNYTTGYLSSGYVTTTNYMINITANGSGLVQMTNTTIPVNTAITIEFSNDGSSWTGTTTLIDGFQSIDLRDLNYTAVYERYNFSTTDSSVTPRIYQSRLITTIGVVSTETQNVTGEWITYNLTSIITLIGTHDAGNLNSTLDIDGDIYNCSETVGSPAYRISFNWIDIDITARCYWVTGYFFYDGSASHEINIELYNFTSTNWVHIGQIDDDVGFEWHNVTIYNLRIPSDFVNSSGAVLGRLDHEDAGNINHDIRIEYLKLLAFVPSGLAVSGGLKIYPLFLYILISIVVITGVYAWKKY